MLSWIQTRLKTTAITKTKFLQSLPLILIALLLFTNPKHFNYTESKVKVHNQVINRIERVLKRAEARILGHTDRDELSSFYLFSLYTRHSSSKLFQRGKKTVYLGILRAWFRLSWLDYLPDCIASSNCNYKGVCIRNGQCLCLPGYKSENCASRIAKFQSLIKLFGTNLSLIDIYFVLSLASSAAAGLLSILKPHSTSKLILNHFKAPNLIHQIYALFIFHKYAPLLYALIGSRNFGYLLALCHCLRFASSLVPKVMFYFQSSSVLSLINLTSLMILNQLKSGHTTDFTAEGLSEYVRFIATDVLLSLNISAFWIGLEAIICASILLKFIFLK